ncbi:Transmembrane and coiled-coil domain-containing protein 7 [Habropoda laboriosa]|uniref:Transmembrane and coiled-coil domain-containing protein 7 n=1 Tax=Habropoda laboriosa TaxID=597456 RepID=A0A0L7QLX2_9HYME|nr:Transmembrane and coiled-coil domain-containing protein 7 [Habropoda laboriosa]
MNYHEILLHLTTINPNENDFDNRLQQILQKIEPMLTENAKKFVFNNIENENDIRYQYICTFICVLQNMKIAVSTNNDSLFSVKEFHTLKVCIEFVIAMGVIPGLLPGVGVNTVQLCPKPLQMYKKNLTDLQKYRRLQFTVNSLMELYDEIMFRSAILAQIGPLIAALLQLCHAPLMKPSKKCVSTNEEITGKNKFKMTPDLYDELIKDQEHFKCLLHRMLTNCPRSISMKELMVILGIKGAPKWLQCETRKYLVQQLMQCNGVVSIVAAICDDNLDFGEDWNKLDTISKLIATSHGNNSDEYYKSICLQLLDLLVSTQVKHSTTIANCCITALYEYNPNVCRKNIVEKVCDPLLVNSKNEQEIMKTEDEVVKCIENLMKCFITVESKFKQLPCRLLMNIAVPLFSLYNNVRQSACVLKSKIKQLILLLLHDESSRNDLFAAFLGYTFTNNFGNRLLSKFGPTGGIEIVGIDNACKYEEFADSLFDLICNDEILSIELFIYLLKFLSRSIEELDQEKEDKHLLETEDGKMEKIEEQLTAVKLLSNLASMSTVQEAQIEKPKPIISFIKSLFNQYIKERHSLSEEDDCEILYVSLMLVKMILSERKKPLDSSAFTDFVKFLKECCTFSNISPQLLLLTKELIELFNSQGRSEQRYYQDLSVDSKLSNKFEEALKDLTDPLLPVRAHGLITITKLIENMDPCITTSKAILLQLFEENLKHEDSFIYLAAINGLCALANSYPQVVIETLVQEYIDMPQRLSTGEITVETRIKLGEILVKVTRALGEMTTAYKNILINGFLCATRDSDSLVRASSLSCLGELCKILGFRLGNIVIEVIYCISCIVRTDKAPECRRAAVMVSSLLLRGLGQDTLTSLGKDLVDLYRGLKYLRDNDDDPVLRLHAQLALEELDHIVRNFLFSSPKLEKGIFLLGSP